LRTDLPGKKTLRVSLWRRKERELSGPKNSLSGGKGTWGREYNRDLDGWLEGKNRSYFTKKFLTGPEMWRGDLPDGIVSVEWSFIGWKNEEGTQKSKKRNIDKDPSQRIIKRKDASLQFEQVWVLKGVYFLGRVKPPLAARGGLRPRKKVCHKGTFLKKGKAND